MINMIKRLSQHTLSQISYIRASYILQTFLRGGTSNQPAFSNLPYGGGGGWSLRSACFFKPTVQGGEPQISLPFQTYRTGGGGSLRSACLFKPTVQGGGGPQIHLPFQIYGARGERTSDPPGFSNLRYKGGGGTSDPPAFSNLWYVSVT